MKTLLLFLFVFSSTLCFSQAKVKAPVTYLWPLPAEYTSGNETLTVDPALSLVVGGNGGSSGILKVAFDRYKAIIFNGVGGIGRMKQKKGSYDISKVRVVVQSASEDLNLGVDESYTLFVLRKDGKAIVGEATIEAKQWSYIVLIKQGAKKQLNINHYNEYIQLLVGLDYVFGEKQLTNRWSILYSQNWNYIFDHTAPDNTKYFDV